MNTSQTLQTVVTDSTALLHQIQNVHWNVTGAQFYPIHKLTEEQYEELFPAIDEVAERLRAIGHTVIITPESLVQSKVPQIDSNADAKTMLQGLIAGHEVVRASIQIAIETADDADDEGTEDLMIARAQVHDKALWMLKAMLA